MRAGAGARQRPVSVDPRQIPPRGVPTPRGRIPHSLVGEGRKQAGLGGCRSAQVALRSGRVGRGKRRNTHPCCICWKQPVSEIR